VLVCTGLNATWKPREEIEKVARFLFDAEDGNLFIVELPSLVHGDVHGLFGDQSTRWRDAHGLADDISALVAARIAVAGLFKEPDIQFAPRRDLVVAVPGETPAARVIVEIEYANRGPKALRAIGRLYMTQPDTRSFIGMKIYKRDAAGLFAAIAVVWRKTPAGIQLSQAAQFGTKPLHVNSRNAWAQILGALHLPHVPLTTPLPFPGPVPAAAAAPPAAWQLTIAGADFVHNGANQAVIPVALPVPGNFVIDLANLCRLLNSRPVWTVG
jgi:hypothetical protein